ncbi:MAG: hypothetical protein ACM3ZE_02260 [Myxococcales bacterium]
MKRRTRSHFGSAKRLPFATYVGFSVAGTLVCAVACSGGLPGSGGDQNDQRQNAVGGATVTSSGGNSAASSTAAKRSTAGGASQVRVDVGIGGTTEESSTGTPIADPNDNRVVQEKCAATSAMAVDNVKITPADIIFAVDGSSSMAVETEFVKTYMNQFSQKIMDSGIDVHVILIASPSSDAAGAGGAASTTTRGGIGATRVTTGICIDAPLGSGQCPDDTKLPNYYHETSQVTSFNALNLFVSTFKNWKSHLRQDSTKSLVVVSDDSPTDAPNNSASAFTKNFTALDPELLEGWTFNGVFCATQCTDAASIGKVYADLVEQTGGVSGDLCEQKFEPVFNRLAEQIITTSSTIACEWELPSRDGNQTFSPSLVQVNRIDSNGSTKLARVAAEAQCGDNGGWYFDSNLNPTKILACENTCNDMQNATGGKVEIEFACESIDSCVANDSSALKTDSCTWPIPKPPSGQELVYSTVNVRYTSASGFATDLGKVDSEADCGNVEEGWYYDNAEKPTNVIACPQTCKQTKAGGSESKLEVLFGCETSKAPPIINI